MELDEEVQILDNRIDNATNPPDIQSDIPFTTSYEELNKVLNKFMSIDPKMRQPALFDMMKMDSPKVSLELAKQDNFQTVSDEQRKEMINKLIEKKNKLNIKQADYMAKMLHMQNEQDKLKNIDPTSKEFLLEKLRLKRQFLQNNRLSLSNKISSLDTKPDTKQDTSPVPDSTPKKTSSMKRRERTKRAEMRKKEQDNANDK